MRNSIAIKTINQKIQNKEGMVMNKLGKATIFVVSNLMFLMILGAAGVIYYAIFAGIFNAGIILGYMNHKSQNEVMKT